MLPPSDPILEPSTGDLVPVALGGHRGGAPTADHLGGDANGPAPDGQQFRKGCLGVPAHAASLPPRCVFVPSSRKACASMRLFDPALDWHLWWAD